MHFTFAPTFVLTTLLALHFPTVTANTMELTSDCKGNQLPAQCRHDHSVMHISSTNQSWHIDANDGCRRTFIPLWKPFHEKDGRGRIDRMHICVDWTWSRAHSWYDEPSRLAEKTCYAKHHFMRYRGCAYDYCEKSWWNEVPCGGQMKSMVAVGGGELGPEPVEDPAVEKVE